MNSQQSELNKIKLQAQNYKDRMSLFFDQVPAAICILDGPQLTYEMINPSYQKLFPGRALLGKSVFDALPEIVGTPIQQLLEDVYYTGQTFEGKEVQIYLAQHDGGPLDEYYFNFIYQPRRNLTDNVDGIQVFAFEVTEYVQSRKAKEELTLKIDQQAKAFDIALSSIKDFVYTFDTSGRFTYSNKPLLDLLGISLNEIIGKNFHELPYPAELAERLQLQISKVVAEGKEIADETLYINPEGKHGYYEYIFTPILDKKGNIIQVAGSTRDITERKRAEESIRIKNAELTKINNELDNFIYTASHDLRAPISNIEGLIIAIKKYLSIENMQHPMVIKLFQMIQASIDRFKQTLSDLTDIAKIQRIKEEDLSDISLESVVEDIKLDLYSLFDESNAKLILDIQECPIIHFSRINLRSILYNLISNAIKYRDTDRPITIKLSCKSQEKFNLITIEDNGMGMDLTNQISIFGMFKRLHTHVEGTGIGLYIVKKMVENAGGKIEVESQVNIGSTFKIYLRKV